MTQQNVGGRPYVNSYTIEVRLHPEQVHYVRSYASEHTNGNVNAALRAIVAEHQGDTREVVMS